jgi:hypothetical protein
LLKPCRTAGEEVGETDDFFRYMQSANFDFEVTREPWDLYIEEKGYGSLGYAGFHDWHILQGRYALCLLFEYVSTLGLIDVAYVSPVGARRDYTELWGVDDLDFFSRYDGLLYFRLTPLGAYALGLADEYTPAPLEAKSSLRVLPSLKVVVSGETAFPGLSRCCLKLTPRKPRTRNGISIKHGQWRLSKAAIKLRSCASFSVRVTNSRYPKRSSGSSQTPKAGAPLA